jgi:hypothetical protein
VDICRDQLPPITERGDTRARCWVPPEDWTVPRSGGVSQEVAG